MNSLNSEPQFSKNQLTFDDTYRVQQRFHGNKTFVVVAAVAAAVGAVDAKLRKIQFQVSNN